MGSKMYKPNVATIMKRILLLYVLFAISTIAYCQSVDEIKADRSNYLWGEGSGITLKKADQEALAMLISQISTQVESSFTLLKEEMTANGNSEGYKETFESVVKTYSGATLKNTERIVLGNEPDAKVFRYIKRDEIAKVFKERKEKILGFVENAENAKKDVQIADALRYYYWALTLLKSHPEGNSIETYDDKGQKQLLATWLPKMINDVFAKISIQVAEKELDEAMALYSLSIRYAGQKVSNFDYSYWDGADYTNIISARNGVGSVELYGVSKDTEKLKLKAEYIFEGEARIDRELEDVLKKIDPIPFRYSYFTVDLKDKQNEYVEVKKASAGEVAKADNMNSGGKAVLTEVSNPMEYKKNIDEVLQSIKLGNYTRAQDVFTTEGYDVFTKLISYGNAKLIGTPELKFIEFEDKVICRAVPMSFNFKSNNKKFVEEVVFQFNKEGKIDALSFALSQVALDDIIGKDVWDERDRLILVNFLESYKTAYALKRIEYIEQIFSDDALIITGKVVKVKPNELNQYKSNRIVKYNKQTKQQYVKNLRYSFGSKEYINLKFEQSKIRKAGKGGDIYGVQIKQNYFSSNYGDVGYLFLMVDLNNPDEPIIHVRTWQHEIGVNDSIYGLSDFN
jgi:hypothetical protein